MPETKPKKRYGSAPLSQEELSLAMRFLNDNPTFFSTNEDNADDPASEFNRSRELQSKFKKDFPNVAARYMNKFGTFDMSRLRNAWVLSQSGTSKDFKRDATGNIMDFSDEMEEVPAEQNTVNPDQAETKPAEVIPAENTTPVVNKKVSMVPGKNQSVFQNYGGVSNWYNQKPV